MAFAINGFDQPGKVHGIAVHLGDVVCNALGVEGQPSIPDRSIEVESVGIPDRHAMQLGEAFEVGAHQVAVDHVAQGSREMVALQFLDHLRASFRFARDDRRERRVNQKQFHIGVVADGLPDLVCWGEQGITRPETPVGRIVWNAPRFPQRFHRTGQPGLKNGRRPKRLAHRIGTVPHVERIHHGYLAHAEPERGIGLDLKHIAHDFRITHRVPDPVFKHIDRFVGQRTRHVPQLVLAGTVYATREKSAVAQQRRQAIGMLFGILV